MFKMEKVKMLEVFFTWKIDGAPWGQMNLSVFPVLGEEDTVGQCVAQIPLEEDVGWAQPACLQESTLGFHCSFCECLVFPKTIVHTQVITDFNASFCASLNLCAWYNLPLCKISILYILSSGCRASLPPVPIVSLSLNAYY